MTSVGDIADWMQRQAPLELSESWDNTGLLMGDRAAPVSAIMTCLTLTPESTAEAVERGVQMVITHHPLPFKPISRITTDSVGGCLLWQLARHGISVYSPHTAWDSAARGINALLAERLALVDCQPLVPAEHPDCPGLGAGRIGNLTQPLELRGLAEAFLKWMPESRPRGVDSKREIRRVAIACGSGASLLPQALRAGCDLFLTGEASFHHCLEVQAQGISLLLLGHFASECFAMRHLAELLEREHTGLAAMASERERDPVIDMG